MFRLFHHLAKEMANPALLFNPYRVGSKENPIKVFARTPHPPLHNKANIQLLLDIKQYQAQAINALEGEDFHVNIFEHQLRDQKSFSSNSNNTFQIRNDALNDLLKANIFAECHFNPNLWEKGSSLKQYYSQFLDAHQYSIHEPNLMDSIGNINRPHIVPVLEGGCFLTIFVDYIPSTIFNAEDTYHIPILLINKNRRLIDAEVDAAQKVLPHMLICEGLPMLAEILPLAYKKALKLILRHTHLEAQQYMDATPPIAANQLKL